MVFPSEQEQIEKFEKDHVAQHYFEVLRTLISKKSVFAQQVGLKEVANYLGEIFKRVGAEVEIDESYTAPFVMAHFKSSRPDAKTLIFYNHYDTVPADGDQVWTEDPFTLSVRNGFMYGRGVDDDKGHITARLSALRKYMQHHDDLPVNISFIMEGAEESASTDLDKYLEKHADKLRGADLLVWEQGTKNALEQLEISGGNKGIVTFDAKVKSADVDIQMSYRSDMSAPAILNVIELAKKFYPQGVSVLPTTAGTGPMHTVFDALEVPMVAFGLGNANSRDHGGDENVRIADYYTHIELVEELIRSYE